MTPPFPNFGIPVGTWPATGGTSVALIIGEAALSCSRAATSMHSTEGTAYLSPTPFQTHMDLWPLWVVAALGLVCISRAPAPCLEHSALGKGPVGHPVPQLMLGDAASLLHPVAIGEASTTESKSILGNTFLPTYNETPSPSTGITHLLLLEETASLRRNMCHKTLLFRLVFVPPGTQPARVRLLQLKGEHCIQASDTSFHAYSL